MIEWTGAALGFVGYLAVLRWPGKRAALWPWLVGNPIMAYVSWSAGLWGQGCLWAAYFIGTLYGWAKWKK